MLALGNNLPSSPLVFDDLPVSLVLTLFVALSVPVILLGRATIRWQGPARGWTTVGVRLAVLWTFILLLAGARWERHNRDVEVIVLRDVSASMASVPHPPGRTLIEAEDRFLKNAELKKRASDRIGVISFDHRPRIDALPDTRLRLRPRDSTSDAGTNIASAIQLALATFRADAMRRLVIISDGNATQGDTLAALDAAAGAGVTVDVVPLQYRVTNDVTVDRLIAPSIRREDEGIILEALLRSTNAIPVDGRLVLTDRGGAVDLDPQTPGVQPFAPVRLNGSATNVSIKLPPLPAGMHSFVARFEPSSPAHDRLSANNSAEAITFVRGRPRVLYVDNAGRGEGELLAQTLRNAGLQLGDADHIASSDFPTSAADVSAYDAIILANVPRGTSAGLNLAQERALVQYVRDLAGGLLVIGGPQALGAGQWQGSELEAILPIDVQPAERRTSHAGALIIVLDRSASMADALGGMTKQQAANAAAIRAIQALAPRDQAGVIGFNTSPRWVVPLAPNRPAQAAHNISTITPAGGTAMAPALEMAVDALATLTPQQARVRHIVLLTDGVSAPAQYDQLLAKMFAARITLATVAIGGDSDRHLLSHLARRGGGAAYGVSDVERLCDAFVREAQSLRRPLVLQPPGGIRILGDDKLPPLIGMVLTEPKPLPNVQIPLRADTPERDPVLAQWQYGLGKVAVFTGDATSRWARRWVSSPAFASFWPRTVRSIIRMPSSDFDVRTIRDGPRTRVIVEAVGPGGRSNNFLTFTGRQMGVRSGDVRLQQVGPGVYETTLDTPDPGAYFITLRVNGPSGDCGTLLAGAVVSSAAELRELQSNDALLTQMATRTGGRILTAFDPSADLFTREGLRPSSTSQPITGLLLIALMSMIILDVAVRRVAWDWQHSKELFATVGVCLHGFFTTRSIEARPTLANLRRARKDIDQKLNTASARQIGLPSHAQVTTSQQHIPLAEPRGYAVCLKAAKQRAREQIHQIEINQNHR